MYILIIKVTDGKKTYEIITQEEITIEEIKKRCQKEFNISEKDINNINLWFIDEDNDKNLISNINELMSFIKEIDSNNFLINLKVEINNKKNKDFKKSNIIEKEEKDKILNNKNNITFKNKNIYETRTKEENDNIIIKIKKENELLKKLVNYYQEKIKEIVKYYEKVLIEKYSKTLNYIIQQDIIKGKEIKENEIILENKIINKKTTEQINNLKNKRYLQDNNINEIKVTPNETTEKESLQIKKNEIDILNDMKFIKNKCKNCNKYSDKNIYLCIFCDKYYLCDNCYKNNNKNKKFHEHEHFFEINFPNYIIKKYHELEILRFNYTINSFYNIINNIFFDENGNISTKQINLDVFNNLKEICIDMKNVRADPNEYYTEFQNVYIKKELKKMEEESKSLIYDKINIFLVKLNEYNI